MNGQFLMVALLTGTVLGPGGLMVYPRHANRQLFVQLQKLQAERDSLAVEWELLQLEQSTLVTDSAVEETARKRLNMLTPDPSEVLYIKPHE